VGETPESTIRKYKRKCAISYSDIAEIQMEVLEREEPPFPFLQDKPKLVQRMKMNVVTDEKTHEFIVSEKQFNEAVNLLRSVLPDKLSVSDQGKLAKKLKDQLRELDDQLSKGSITLEEHKAKKKKLRWELAKLIAPVVQRGRLKKKQYALFFAPERVILAWIDKSIGEGLKYEYRDELAQMSPDTILRAHERSFAISYPDIADVEIKRKPPRIRVKVTEPDRNGMLRVDKHTYGFKILYRQGLSDDYVNLVRSVLPDRLSVPITQEDQLAWELEDQLRGLKEQLDRGTITQEEYEQEKNKLQKRSL